MATVLTHEAFTENINTTFHVPVDAAQRLELELTEVSDPKKTPGQEQFAILFRGPRETFLGQGIRPFEHGKMGKFELFIVPIRRDQEGYYYEAVFNRFDEGG